MFHDVNEFVLTEDNGCSLKGGHYAKLIFLKLFIILQYCSFFKSMLGVMLQVICVCLSNLLQGLFAPPLALCDQEDQEVLFFPPAQIPASWHN